MTRQDRSDTAGIEMVAENEARRCPSKTVSSWLVGFVFLCCLPQVGSARDLTTNSRPKIHGPVEFLNDSLFTSTPKERLLDVARRELQQGDRDAGFQALLEIFKQPHDSFAPLAASGASGSQYQAAMDIVASADTETKSLWVRMVEPLAAEALKNVAKGSLTLEDVARRFPLTPSASSAQATLAIVAHSRGEDQLAFSVLSQMPPSQNANLDRVKAKIQSRVPAFVKPQMAGRMAASTPDRLAVPWTNRLWGWQEDLWAHPQLTIWSDLLKPVSRRLLSWNSWQPVLRDDTVYLRTPARVIAFDKRTGQVAWSVQTDTLKPENRQQLGQNQVNQTAPALNEILRRDGMGTVAVSESHVFFLDHYRVFHGSRQNFQFRGRNQLRFQSLGTDSLQQKNGNRLVAVRHSPTPSIAWSIGDAPKFDYTVTTGNVPDIESPKLPKLSDNAFGLPSEKTDLESPANLFADHRFCGVPVVHERRLFVVTMDKQSYFLSCLSEATGKVRWQQPLAYLNGSDNGQRGISRQSGNEDTGASLCGVVGGVVICALNNGLVIGTHINDGRFLWATNLRDGGDVPLQSRLRQMIAVSLNVSPGIRSRPILFGTRLYWAAPYSKNVRCLDTETGAILWSASRTNSGLGRLEGTSDLYVAGATDSEVLCIGTRHLRALDAQTGTELWLTSVSDQTGRAFCNNEFCLVSQPDGSIVQVDVKTGRVNKAASIVNDPNQYIGAVVADDDVVCVATPTAISVSPTVPAWQKHSVQGLTLDRARSELLLGNAESAVSILKQVVAGADSDEAAEAKSLLVSSALYLHKENKDAGGSQLLDSLDGIELTAKQKIKVAIASPDAAPELSTLRLSERLPSLELDNDWTVRADVAAWSHLSQQQAQNVTSLGDRVTRTSRLEHAILFPQHVGDLDALMDFAREAVRNSQYAAAEMLLLSARTTSSAAEQPLLNNEIDRIRGLCCETSVTSADRVQVERLEISQTQMLSSDDGIGAMRGQIRMHVDAPDWYPHRLFLASRSLISGNFEFGTAVNELRLPAPVDAAARPVGKGVPSIVPVVSRNAIGAISLLHPSGPRLLWWRKIEREEYDLSPLELGSFGPDFLTVSTGTDLLCVHPLTGRQLWRRSHNDGAVRQGMLYRFPRITGNSSVLGSFGQRMKSYEALRTSDGRSMGAFAVDIPSGQIPLTCGQTILYHVDRVLVLHDFKTHENLLSGRPPLKVQGAGQAQLLAGQRAVTISEDLDLLVLDMTSGDIQVQCSLKQILDAEKLVGLKVFERNDHLYVLLKDWNGARSRRSASSRMGEEKLDSGILCKIDPDSGTLLWHRQIGSCVVPVIYGPETNLMVTWNWKDPVSLLQQQLGSRRLGSQRSMSVEVLNIDTGETVAETSHLNPAEPLRCVHNEPMKTIQLISPTSVVEMKYE